ncbi:hypothetical protein GS399_05200 [Pedobacter sp. HMF7647]|uniref:Uncharacterized protein n=1 Tax=Hufsiella arboris TaxID=2695275 RepID=A0A7K1Y7I9_9SPHI|nr:hypothetical protein [Hufsiella arboris]MXV50361.1 hypothetical protein [Hufsiella arboris]
MVILLHDELNILTQLGSSISPAAYESDLSAAGQRESWERELDRECSRLKALWTGILFDVLKDRLLERYIQFNQTRLIDLCNLVQADLGETSKKAAPAFVSDHRHLGEKYLSALFDLLNFIERYFTKFFNQDLEVPRAYLALSLNEMRETIRQIDETMLNRQIDLHLQECIRAYLKGCGEAGPRLALTYRQLIYLKTFVEELNGDLAAEPTVNINLRLARKLVYLNFNQLSFFAYCQDMIRAEADDSDMYEHQQAVYLRYLTSLKSTQTKPDVFYHKDWPSVKHMLESWLQDEVTAVGILISNQLPQGAVLPAKIDKAALNLSVAQLACLLRMMVEEQVFLSDNVSELFRFIAAHYRSKRQEHISAGSLSKEFYGISQVTAANVLGLLQRMSSRINKHYFPVVLAAGLAGFFGS